MAARSKLQTVFGIVLKEARTKADLSQEKLALESGLDRTFISLLERGLRQPTLTTLFSLAESLGVKPSKLITSVEGKVRR